MKIKIFYKDSDGKYDEESLNKFTTENKIDQGDILFHPDKAVVYFKTREESSRASVVSQMYTQLDQYLGERMANETAKIFMEEMLEQTKNKVKVGIDSAAQRNKIKAELEKCNELIAEYEIKINIQKKLIEKYESGLIVF